MSTETNTAQESARQNAIKNRVDFILVFSADNANPNGDPGYDNRPRSDAYTGTGYVTDVCIKRKIRNRIEMMKELTDGYDIWVRSGTFLRETISNAFSEIHKEAVYGSLKTDQEKEIYERRRICEKFFDIRAFGGVLTSDSESGEEDEKSSGGKDNKKGGQKTKSKVGQVRGPVSIQYAKSVAPILVEDDDITRVCPTKFDKNKPGKKTEMGRKKRVTFAVYVTKGSVSVRLAEGVKGTGFSDDDLELLKKALATLFVGDESTARPVGSMIVQKLVFFTHTSKDGDEPVHKTLERVKVSLKPEFQDKPLHARDMAEYAIEVNEDNMPASIAITQIV